MAKNRTKKFCNAAVVDVAEGMKSGDAVLIGNGLPGVALTDRSAAGKATVQFNGEFEFAVEGKNKAGEKAIEEGDILYIKGGKLSVNNEEGTRYGYALGAVVKNKTETIRVKIGY